MITPERRFGPPSSVVVMLAAVDKWRRKQNPIPSVSDAIRALIELGLRENPAVKRKK